LTNIPGIVKINYQGFDLNYAKLALDLDL